MSKLNRFEGSVAPRARKPIVIKYRIRDGHAYLKFIKIYLHVNEIQTEYTCCYSDTRN